MSGVELYAFVALLVLWYLAIGQGVISAIEVLWMRSQPPTCYEHAMAVMFWPIAAPLAVFVRWLAGRYANSEESQSRMK